MDINDLKSFLVIARHQNLRSAASELHQTPSALSKAIRRLEESLHTDVFDRIGKSLQLNADGELLRHRAEQLVNLAEQTRADFRGERQQIHCRIAGPAILQWKFGTAISVALREQHPGSGIAFQTVYEDAALALLAKGSADFAIVTEAALHGSLPAGMKKIDLGTISMQLAAAEHHALIADKQKASAESSTAKATNKKAPRISRVLSFSTAQVLQHDFACPPRSMFCGLERGARSDGWRDDQIPRKIRFWIDDLHLLVRLVQSGQALAYLPDFVLEQADLRHIKVRDCPYECIEKAWLVWRPKTAAGWQLRLVDALK